MSPKCTSIRSISRAASPIIRSLRGSLSLSGLVILLIGALSACSSLDGIGRSIFGASTGPTSSAAKTLEADQAADATLPISAAPHENAGLNQPDQSASLQVTAKSPALEVTWKIPDEPSPSYVIYYGKSPEALVERVEVATARLETIEDPKEGRLYRYLVPDVPAEGELYVAITAFDGETESPRSNSLSVEAAP